MRHHVLGTRVAILGLVLATGCSTEVSLPDGAKISCGSQADCPAGFVCHLGRCVPAGALDTTPPDFAAAPAVTPAVGGAGTRFTIELEITEPLDEPPVVSLSLAPPAVAPCAATGPTRYACSYTAAGTENGGFGGVVSFDVRMRDRAQNETLRILAGALDLDFAPPVLAAASVAPAAVPLAGVLQVFFTASEPLGGAPVLVASRPLDDGAGGAARFPLQPQPGTLNYEFAHLVTAADPQGAVQFEVEVVDAAGNAATRPVGALVIDSVAPLIGSLAVSPLRASASATATATFDVSEPVSVAVTLGGREVPCGAVQATSPSYTCAWPMQGDEIPPDSEAGEVVLVEVADAAGNRSTASASLVLDFRPPRIAAVSVAYLPAPSNPLPEVAQATAGTTYRVSLVADEALDTAVVPTLVVETPTGAVVPLSVVPGSLGASAVTFEHTVPAGAVDGLRVPTLSWTDLAGNRATLGFASPPIRVKTSPPVLTVRQDRVTYLRSPWGNAAPEDLGGFVVPAGPYFALAPADPLSPATTLPPDTFAATNGAGAAVRVWADGARSGLLGVVLPNPDGSWPRARLAAFDAKTAWATVLDDAGNESAPVRIVHTEWVATAAAAADGSRPHPVDASLYLTETLTPGRDTSLPDPGGLEGLDGATALVEAQPVFRRLLGARPPPRSRHAVAYDAGRGVLVLHGGENATGLLGDTWEYDGENWVERSSGDAGPGRRSGHAMVYDAARNRVLLYGGTRPYPTDPVTDTWEWDGARWVEVTPAGPSPGFRNSLAMAYDSARARTVLHGGSTDTAIQADTWEWDGAAWTEASTNAPASPRIRFAMAYDARRGRVVLFGGENPRGASFQNDLWEYDGVSWVERTPPPEVVDQPVGRDWHSLVYDAARERVVLFGGRVPSGSSQTVWEWDGAAWARRALSAGTPPAERWLHAAAFDAARGRMVVTGGATSADPSLDETWDWDGGARSWTDRTSGPEAPPPVSEHAMVYDESRGRVVLVGGDTTGSDVWEWDGHRWWRLSPPVGPGLRTEHGLAYDRSAGRVVLFGSRTDVETWQWDGTGWARRALAAGSAVPAPRIDPGLTYDWTGQALVLFGGLALNDTWRLTGPAAGPWTWAQSPGPGPAGSWRWGHSLLFDGARTLSFFGRVSTPVFDAVSEVWAFDGFSWSEATPSSGALPPAREYQAMAWDSTRQRAVLFGGAGDQVSGGLELGDLWEWDGGSFRQIARPPRGPWPAARSHHAMAFDALRSRAVLVGGASDMGRINLVESSTWELDTDLVGTGVGLRQERLPMAQLTVSTRGAGFDESSAELLTVRARAGGQAGAAAGAQLLGWSRGGGGGGPGQWLALAANGDGLPLASAPAGMMRWSAAAPGLASFFLRGDQALAFQLRPAARAAPADPEAVLEADYLEVRIRYAAP